MRLNILLLEDVETLGRSGDILSVKSGYARNFLFPKKKAVKALKHTARMQEKLQEERAKKAAIDKKDSEELAKRLEGVVLSIEVKVDPENKMYGSVSQADILHLFADKGYEIEKSCVVLKHPIKELGVSELYLKLKEGVMAPYHVKVVAEGSALEIEDAQEEKAIEPSEEE